jgi:hypothetical protein
LPLLPLIPRDRVAQLADVPIRWLLLGLVVAGIGAFVKQCVARGHNEDRYLMPVGQTLRVAVGQELDLICQTIGPGEYESPPTVSSSSLQFLDATLLSPNLPSGLTQLFRFKGAVPGQAIVVIHHSVARTPPLATR